VHEEFYDTLSGIITDIDTKEDDYGKRWMVTLEEGENKYILQMNFSSSYSSAFLKTLPNVDFTKPVILAPKMTKEGDKTNVTLFVIQDGHALKRFYTKENPNGLPEMTQKKIKGKLTWDDSEMMEYLEKMVRETILPKLKGRKVNPVAVTEGEKSVDDLPF
jgi:chaperonin GroEL (HSP60 family)